MKSYVHGTASRGRTVVGSFTPRKFVTKSGKLWAVGKLNVVTRGPGKDLHRVKYGVALPVKRGSVANVGTFGSGSRMPSAAAVGSCDVLNLVLGPLDLNLLGLKVHLDKVVLDITAVAGRRQPARQPAVRRRRPARRDRRPGPGVLAAAADPGGAPAVTAADRHARRAPDRAGSGARRTY